MFVSAGKGLAFQRRTATGGTSTSTVGPAGSAPYWVKLTRKASVFSAYVSTNGPTWTLVGTQSITMASTIYIGLPLTSHADGAVATATVDHVQ